MQIKKTINWYDRFSKIYDWMSDYPYTEPRKAAIETLQLQEGDVVLDLFCGTGIVTYHLIRIEALRLMIRLYV